MGSSQQKKGAAGERELADILTRAGYPVRWGGNKTFGAVPDLSGLAGVHIECKRVERLNLTEAMEQSERDARRFGDGVPTVFHRRNHKPWLVTMRLTDWLNLYKAQDHEQDARAFFYPDRKGDHTMDRYWDTETPITANTGRNIISYYPEAGMLHFGKMPWTDKRTGEQKQGKTVAVDLAALAKCPAALNLLRQALKGA